MTNLTNAQDVSNNIHRYMVPLLGILFTILLIASWLVFAFKPSWASILRWVNLGLCILQAFLSIFFWFNPIWTMALQLLVVAIFGIFALITNSPDHLKVFGYLALFNTLSCFGRLEFMYGTAANLLDALSMGSNCDGYYGTSDSDALCYEYVNYLRFLAFIIIALQPLETFFAYLSYKRLVGEETAPAITGYGNIADKLYEGQRNVEAPHTVE